MVSFVTVNIWEKRVSPDTGATVRRPRPHGFRCEHSETGAASWASEPRQRAMMEKLVKQEPETNFLARDPSLPHARWLWANSRNGWDWQLKTPGRPCA